MQNFTFIALKIIKLRVISFFDPKVKVEDKAGAIVKIQVKNVKICRTSMHFHDKSKLKISKKLYHYNHWAIIYLNPEFHKEPMNSLDFTSI